MFLFLAAIAVLGVVYLTFQSLFGGSGAKSGECGSFESYLKQDLARPNDGDMFSFESFLKSNDTVSSAEHGKQATFLVSNSEPGKLVLILYGTEYGASREIAEKLAEELQEEDMRPRVINMKDHKAIDLSQEQALLIVCSTAGDGVPPTEAKGFYDWANSNSAAIPPSFPFSVLALGDSNYPHFCRAGRTLDKRLSELGGTRLFPRGDVDQEDSGVISGWTRGVKKALGTLALQEIPEYLAGKTSDSGSDAAEGGRHDRYNPLMATVAERRELTTRVVAGDCETLHLEIDITGSSVTYTAGDSLGVLPANHPESVSELIQHLHWDPRQLVPAPSWSYLSKASKEVTLSEALEKCYDLKSVKPELLRCIAEGAQWGASGSDRHRAAGLIAGGLSRSNAALMAYLEPREVVDVLADFPSVRPSFTQLATMLKQLTPRYYSISSSPVLQPNRISLTVAIVRYSTLSKQRYGVATTWLADRVAVGSTIPVFVNSNPEFRLPFNPAVPIIMIGPGTGLAPFRAFIQERCVAAAGEAAANVLFFGCRYSSRDFLYGDELKALEGQGRLQLHTAFSRETSQKVYVQHRVRENGPALWALLKNGAHLYVCGDAKQMASDVHAALQEVVAAEGNLASLAEADAMLQKMMAEKRYQRDVWA